MGVEGVGVHRKLLMTLIAASALLHSALGLQHPTALIAEDEVASGRDTMRCC